MRNRRMMTGAICAALLGVMTAFHAYGDYAGVSGAGTKALVVAEAAQEEIDKSAQEEAAEVSQEEIAVAAQKEAAEAAESTGNAGSGGDTAEDAVDSGNSSSAEAGSAGSNGGTAAGSGSALDTSDLFSDRDLEQTADLTGATKVTLSDGETVSIKTEGVYVISGTAQNAQIVVNAGDEDKVQLVLDGVSMTNDSTPCIYVQSADKVFVTTTDSDSSLTVTGTFTSDGTTNTDAVIFSKDDLVLNGTGTLTISSTDNGITSKDDLKVTGGTLVISCISDALEANDSIRIADGTVTVEACKDGLHAENDEDNTVGYVYIGGGTLTINASDDAVHATTIAQVDGGTIDLTAAEGIEGTYIQINDGSITIAAADDGINVGQKSSITTPAVEVNGGEINVTMASGDTDAIDANGNLVLNGGTLNLTAQSPFDYDGTARNNGATIIVNGTQTDTITNQMMGGGRGGMQDGMNHGMQGSLQEDMRGGMQGDEGNWQGNADGDIRGGHRSGSWQ